MHRWRLRGAFQAAFAAALLSLFWPAAGDAVERVALVVGNGGYDPRHIPSLPNPPPNDARLMADALKAVGFHVRLVTDADIATMRTEIEGFGKRLRRAGGDAVGLFYYAGHGVESRGSNYLIPIGAEIDSAVEFEIDAVLARWVLSFMEAAGNRLNMVILDACRNNPYGTGCGAPQGLAVMDAPSGSLIAYSAAPGQAATDGAGDNSPYTAALAGRLAEPGLKLEDVFKRVRVQVEQATGGEQTPWENSSLRGDFYFVARGAPESPVSTVPLATTAPSSPTPQQLAGQAYAAAERTNTVAAFRLVAERFPDTFYAALAKEQIAKLERASTPPASVQSTAQAREESLGLQRAERRRIQAALSAAGFQTGLPDGLFGPRTREAITRWQSAHGVGATGYLDAEAARTLLAAVPPPPAETVTRGPTGPNWITVENQPCKVWHSRPEVVKTITWDGDCTDGIASGRGKLVLWFVKFRNELVYQGDVRRGRVAGRGSIFNPPRGYRYDGEWRDWKKHGRGTGTHPDGSRYEGDYVDDKRHGQGTYLWADGHRYEGAWRDGKPHGYGAVTKSDGDVRRGRWKHGC